MANFGMRDPSLSNAIDAVKRYPTPLTASLQGATPQPAHALPKGVESSKLMGQVYLFEELVSRLARYYELIDAEYLCFHGNTVGSISRISATGQRWGRLPSRQVDCIRFLALVSSP